MARFLLPAEKGAPTFIRLLIVSSVVSTISLIFNLVQVGYYSLWIIPTAWVATATHHITIWCLLSRPGSNKTQDLTDGLPRLLKHGANIWGLHYVSLLWLAGAILTVVWTSLGPPSTARILYLNYVSASFAVIESGLVMTMSVICWKALSKEGYYGIRSSDEVPLKANSVT